jgi:hypothetical protein
LCSTPSLFAVDDHGAALCTVRVAWPFDLGRTVHGESRMREMIAQSHASAHEQQLAQWDAARKFQSVDDAVVDMGARRHIQCPEKTACSYPHLWLAP